MRQQLTTSAICSSALFTVWRRARINHAHTSVLITPNVAAPAKNPGDDLSLPVSLCH